MEHVSVHGLSLTYRSGFLGRHRVPALCDISFDLGPGEIVGIVGPNGSGKTSLFRCLVGDQPADRGDIRVLGTMPGHRATRRRVGYVAEGRLPLGRLTARELLTLSGALAGVALAQARCRADELLDLVGLAAVAARQHGQFSAGMERRLAFAQALYHRPELLVLDEPTAGLDPLGVDMVRETLHLHAAGGGSALVATHGLEDLGAQGFTRLLVLLGGKQAAIGSPDDVLGLAGARQLVLAGLDAAAIDELRARIEARGGRVLREGAARRPLGEVLSSLASARREA